MDKSIRTFIAVELEATIQERLKQIQEQLKGLDADVKWVEPKNIHITLRFLGDTNPKKVKLLSQTLPVLFKDTPAFEITGKSLGAFPTVEKPRVIWAGISQGSENLITLAQKLELGLNACGIGKDDKKFSGHITIGRVRSAKNLDKLSTGIKNFDIAPHLQQKVSRIIFFQSTLTSHGPVYEPITTVELK